MKVKNKSLDKQKAVTSEYLNRQDLVTKKYLREYLKKQDYVSKSHLRSVVMGERKFNAKMFKQAKKERGEIGANFTEFEKLVNGNSEKLDQVIELLEKFSRKTSYLMTKQEVQLHINENFDSRIKALEEPLLAE